MSLVNDVSILSSMDQKIVGEPHAGVKVLVAKSGNQF